MADVTVATVEVDWLNRKVTIVHAEIAETTVDVTAAEETETIEGPDIAGEAERSNFTIVVDIT